MSCVSVRDCVCTSVYPLRTFVCEHVHLVTHLCHACLFWGVCVCLKVSWRVSIGGSSRPMSLTGWITVISHYWLPISVLHTPLCSSYLSLHLSLPMCPPLLSLLSSLPQTLGPSIFTLTSPYVFLWPFPPPPASILYLWPSSSFPLSSSLILSLHCLSCHSNSFILANPFFLSLSYCLFFIFFTFITFRSSFSFSPPDLFLVCSFSLS